LHSRDRHMSPTQGDVLDEGEKPPVALVDQLM
jgi:hypothetical protein